mmetsp:Transcript_8461/g.34401  ORF Transcript_8461/g.34401 Transcript_8461/m.34401 type:complete len:248 (-) Transcript_8461:286-1029(-)
MRPTPEMESFSLVERRVVTCPCPLLLMLARTVMAVSGVRLNWEVPLTPSAVSLRQCMSEPPIEWRVVTEGSLEPSMSSALPPIALSPRASITPPDTTSLVPGRILRRFSSLTPLATQPATFARLIPAAVLFMARFFQRVSARAVYAMSLPTVCTSTPAVDTTRLVCLTLASPSSVMFVSVLFFVICPEMLAGVAERSRLLRGSTELAASSTTKGFSMLKPSMPVSWSQPWLSMTGRIAQLLALSTKR